MSGTRCPQCQGTRVEMTIKGQAISYACLDCQNEWAEQQPSAADTARSAPLDRAEVHRAVEEICGSRDLEPLMAATRRWARKLTGADGVTFVLRARNQCYYADEDAIAPLWKGQRFPLESCVSGWAMLNRQSMMIPDIYADDRVLHAAYRTTFVKSMLMVPVRKDDPVAAIGAYWSRDRVPTEEHLRIVELLADAVAVTLTSGQLWARVRDTIAPEPV